MRYMSLHAHEGVRDEESGGGWRFLLDCPLRGGFRVQALTMEMEMPDADAEELALYFSEDHDGGALITYRASLAPALYKDEATLLCCLETAMHCAAPVSPPGADDPVRNQYRLAITSRRLLIKTDGQAPFRLHTAATSAPVLDRLVARPGVLHYRSTLPFVLLRGAVVDLYRDHSTPLTLRVTGTVGSHSVTVEGHRPLRAEDEQGTPWKMTVRSGAAPCVALADRLGLDTRMDAQGGTRIPVGSWKGSGDGDVDLLTTDRHGCGTGDAVEWWAGAVLRWCTVLETRCDLHLSVRLSTPLPSPNMEGGWIRQLYNGVPNVLIGAFPVRACLPRRAVYVRLWIGATEVISTLVPRGADVDMSAFAYAMAMPRVSSTEASLLGNGRCQVDRARHVTVLFLSEGRRPLAPPSWTLVLGIDSC